ncbi:hypothetical protein B7H23_14610 [Notoacmeibacter marinus]|uniref:PglD N-terminal domain-containing protein n=1 Tax=Notoacmeibacter marinus TaxID=1876515 RepID=A0A231UU90_9HYPH|nr:acetyltransferase [Notoacmeibacter marinus]OXS99390.1 hypothetical protein B7H23_14610 [Notoacmeibacter marinus]
MKTLVLLGAGGHGRVVADAAVMAGWRDVVFLDDGFGSRDTNGVWPIVGPLVKWREMAAQCDLFVSVGDNGTRLRLFKELASAGVSLPRIVHPSAVISAHSSIEAGTVIMAGAILQAFAAIGAAGIVNTGATVDHDCRLDNAVHLSPGAHLAGTVSVGERSWIGMGANVRQGINIGADVMVAAGATVVNDVADRTTVMGVPAAPSKRIGSNS